MWTVGFELATSWTGQEQVCIRSSNLELLILNRSRHWKDVRGRLILKNQKSLKWVSFHYLNCLILYECIKINIVKEMSKNQSVILFHVIIIRILILYLRKTRILLVLLLKKLLTITWTTQKPLNCQKIQVTSMLVTDVGDQMCWWQVWDIGDRFRMLVTD